jgi:hypothetical protein
LLDWAGSGITLAVEWEENNGTNENRGKELEIAVRDIMLLAAFAVTVLLILGGTMIHRKQQAKAPEPIPYAPPPDPMEPAALAALEAFFEAPDLAAKAALVHDSERVRPMLEDFHGTRSHPFPTLGRVSPGQPATFDEKPMVLFEVEPFSGPRYYVAVVWDGRRFAVDWESLTAYGTMDWIDFVEDKPVQPQTMRVFLREAAESDRPPGYWKNSTFFLVEHRDHSQPIVLAASDDLAEKLQALTANRRSPVTLELVWRSRKADEPPIPWIKSLVSMGWNP